MCPTWDVGKVGAMMQGVNFSRFKGFTLVELLVTVALAALLAGLAAPSFYALHGSQRDDGGRE